MHEVYPAESERVQGKVFQIQLRDVCLAHKYQFLLSIALSGLGCLVTSHGLEQSD